MEPGYAGLHDLDEFNGDMVTDSADSVVIELSDRPI